MVEGDVPASVAAGLLRPPRNRLPRARTIERPLGSSAGNAATAQGKRFLILKVAADATEMAGGGGSGPALTHTSSNIRPLN